jgi:hypothetical protein
MYDVKSKQNYNERLETIHGVKLGSRKNLELFLLQLYIHKCLHGVKLEHR